MTDHQLQRLDMHASCVPALESAVIRMEACQRLAKTIPGRETLQQRANPHCSYAAFSRQKDWSTLKSVRAPQGLGASLGQIVKSRSPRLYGGFL